MIYVKGGEFKMGNGYNRTDKRVHYVELNNYRISNLEITNQQFCNFLNLYGSDTVKSGEYEGKLMIKSSNISKKYNWGNYLTYVYKADDTMKTINGNNAIKKQSRRLWGKFHRLMKLHEKRLS